MTVDDSGDASLPPGWMRGILKIKSPLVLDYISTGADGWKRTLSEMYGGRRGSILSREILKSGYDAIITVDSDGTAREIVDLLYRSLNSI